MAWDGWSIPLDPLHMMCRNLWEDENGNGKDPPCWGQDKTLASVTLPQLTIHTPSHIDYFIAYTETNFCL